MRNYTNIDRYYEELMQDIYPQPLDSLHMEWTKEIVDKIAEFLPECVSVLDVGCGEGYAQQIFESHSISYYGININQDDFEIGKSSGNSVYNYDFNFLIMFDNEIFDLIFSRHTLEHSPFPLLTLMEWHRVSRNWLCLVMPNPDHFTYMGRNHYSVAPAQQVRWWLRRAGWRVLWREVTEHEYRFICKKETRAGYEGWADAPLPNEVYENDRDNR